MHVVIRAVTHVVREESAAAPGLAGPGRALFAASPASRQRHASCSNVFVYIKERALGMKREMSQAYYVEPAAWPRAT